MIFPLSTALAVSQMAIGEVFAESFVSIKNLHSFLKYESNSLSLSKDVLNRHLGLVLVSVFLCIMKLIGA